MGVNLKDILCWTESQCNRCKIRLSLLTHAQPSELNPWTESLPRDASLQDSSVTQAVARWLCSVPHNSYQSYLISVSALLGKGRASVPRVSLSVSQRWIFFIVGPHAWNGLQATKVSSVKSWLGLEHFT